MAEKEYIEREAALDYIDNGDGTPIQKLFADLCVLSTPAADVVEVRHGEWEEERWCDNFQHTCSLCHKTVRVHPQSVSYKYCPYCGAKMDGKGDKDG